jgi:hypothetical protein
MIGKSVGMKKVRTTKARDMVFMANPRKCVSEKTKEWLVERLMELSGEERKGY